MFRWAIYETGEDIERLIRIVGDVDGGRVAYGRLHRGRGGGSEGTRLAEA
jgi:hypothetical protein